MKTMVSIMLLLIFQTSSFAQTKTEVEFLLAKIAETDSSRNIINSQNTATMVSYGKDALPILTEFFTDSTTTKVYSHCLSRLLTIGEIAIILADKIEMMPYATLTGIQNCTLTFCEGNPNIIEYYLDFGGGNRIYDFQNKYTNWLQSDERKEWLMKIRGAKIKHN